MGFTLRRRVPLHFGVGTFVCAWYASKIAQTSGPLVLAECVTMVSRRTGLTENAAAQGIRLAARLEYLAFENDGTLSSGRFAPALMKEEIPRAADMRGMLSKATDVARPVWAGLLVLPPSQFLVLVPTSVSQCFRIAGLEAYDTDPTVQEWLRALRRGLETWDTDSLVEIGEAGEILCVAYERARLRSAGRDDLAERVRRVSVESDAYGYDVTSFVGSACTLPEVPSSSVLRIEVKASTHVREGRFQFFVTANEWATALEYQEGYRFDLWEIEDADIQRPVGRLRAVLAVADLMATLPENRSAIARWTNAEVQWPVSE